MSSENVTDETSAIDKLCEWKGWCDGEVQSLAKSAKESFRDERDNFINQLRIITSDLQSCQEEHQNQLAALQKAAEFISITPVNPLNDWFEQRDELLAAIEECL